MDYRSRTRDIVWLIAVAATLVVSFAARIDAQEAAPGPGQQRFIRALELARQGLLDEALAEAEAGAELAPEDPDGHNLLGRLYEGAGRDAEAEAAYQVAMRADPNWAEPAANLGALYLRQEKFRAAIAPLLHATEQDASIPLWHAQLGVAFRQSQQPARAAAAFERAHELAPDDARIVLDLATARQAAGDIDGAIAAAERAATLSPDDAVPLVLAARLKVESGDEDHLVEAPATYRRAIERAPNQPPLWVELGHAYNELSMWHRAADAFRQAIASGDGSPETRLQLGMALAQDLRFRPALEQLDAILGEYPEHARAAFLRGQVRYSLDQMEGALADFEQAIEAMPDNPDPVVEAVRIHLEQGDLEGADAKLTRALAAGRGRADLGLALGRLRARQGRHEEAVEVLRLTLETDPSLLEAEYLLGQSLLRLGRTEEGRAALSAYQQALRDQRDDETDRMRDEEHRAGIYALRARVYLAEGAFSDAITAAQKAIDLTPGNADLYDLLARIHERMGEPEAAAEARRRAEQARGEQTTQPMP